MSEQALDLRRSLRVAWRHKAIVGGAAVAGLAAGAALAVLHPPLKTSQALVVLPASAGQTIKTQVVVAGSNPVLNGALHEVSPPLSLTMLRSRVQAVSLSPEVIAFSGQGRTAAQSEAISNAVARSYLAYVSSAANPIVRVPARMLQPATAVSGSPAAVTAAEDGVLGAVVGALLGIIAALIVSRGDRRLRQRDEIADVIGVPVLAAVPVGRPADSAGWAQLLEEYEPGAVQAWHLRKALQHLGVTDVSDASPVSLSVLSMSCDGKALALGPQLAAFAASLGIGTAFVVDPQPDGDVTATLQAACAAPAAGAARRVRAAVRDRGGSGPPRAPLTVAAAVVDAEDPQVADTMRTTVTVLAVSAGAVTAEQLARVAGSAAGAGRQIAGILVADPDPADRTTGRLPEAAPPARPGRPARRAGTAAETSW